MARNDPTLAVYERVILLAWTNVSENILIAEVQMFTKRNVLIFSLFVALLVSGCMGEFDESSSVQDDCPVLSGSGWNAWVNKMPGGLEPTLNIHGIVALTDSHFSDLWSVGPLDRRKHPGQRLLLNWESSSDDTLSAEREVTFQMPALAQNYSEVIVVCGDIVIASITEIDVVY